MLLASVSFLGNLFQMSTEISDLQHSRFLEQFIDFRCGHSSGSLTWKGKAELDIRPSK